MKIISTPEQISEIGYCIAKGFTKHIGMILLTGLVILIIWNISRYAFKLGMDDSGFSNTKRSDMKVYTDYKTGVQYVGTQNGGLSVRVDKDGKPVCYEGE